MKRGPKPQTACKKGHTQPFLEDGNRPRCPECRSEYHKEYYKKNKERLKSNWTRWMKSNRPMYNKRRRAYKYGIPLDQYDRMVEAQGGKCAICQNERPLVVDHNHSTSVVRSLLCSQCNTGIGQFSDDPNLLRAAADYCEKHANVDIFKAS